MKNKTVVVGIGGPVGSGKSTLAITICKRLRDRCEMAVITNDIYTKEDALMLKRHAALADERIMGVETGGCPHTAIRDDISMNLQAIDEMKSKFKNLELILLESGGDNLTATFSPELVDLFIYVIDVTEGDDIPRKGGPAIVQSDLLIINKVSLAKYVGADTELMLKDAQKKRGEAPLIFSDLKDGTGVDAIIEWFDKYVFFSDLKK